MRKTGFKPAGREGIAIAVLAIFATALVKPMAAQKPDEVTSQLIREAVQNEVSSNSSTGRHFMFEDEKKTQHSSQTKLVVEALEATAGMVIVENGHPLSPEERQKEIARLDIYTHNTEELNKKRKQEKEDAERTERILKALPEAFLYQDEGTEEGTESLGRAGDQLARLKFRPNPGYTPPTRVEQVLTGMVGTVLVDKREKRIAQIDGTLQKEVGFGWGILGHLDPGGRFLVQQADVGGGQWEVTRMELRFTGKVLFFKKLNIQSSDVFSNFQQVASDLTFAQAVELLKKKASEQPTSNAANAEPKMDEHPSKEALRRAGHPLYCGR